MAEKYPMTTRDAAKAVKIGRATLHRWLADGKVKASQAVELKGITIRLWSKADIDTLNAYADEHFGERKGGRRRK